MTLLGDPPRTDIFNGVGRLVLRLGGDVTDPTTNRWPNRSNSLIQPGDLSPGQLIQRVLDNKSAQVVDRPGWKITITQEGSGYFFVRRPTIRSIMVRATIMLGMVATGILAHLNHLSCFLTER